MVILLNLLEHFSELQIRDYSLLTQDIIQILSKIVNKTDIKDILYSLVWILKIILEEIINVIFVRNHILVIREEWIDYNVNLMYDNNVHLIINKIIKMYNHLILDLIQFLILFQIINKNVIQDILYSLVWIAKVILGEIINEIFAKNHILVIREEWIDYNVNLIYDSNVHLIINKIIQVCNHLIQDLILDLIQYLILNQIINKADIKDILYSLVWISKIILEEIINEIFVKNHILVIREEWIDYNVNLMYDNNVHLTISKIMFSLLIQEIITHNLIQMCNLLIQEITIFNINKRESIIKIQWKIQIIYN